MTLQEFKHHLEMTDRLRFSLPGGKKVPAHFHLTEIGVVEKSFIDCGGTMRKERVVSLQLWTSIDYHHRLKPGKLLRIVNLAEEKLGLTNEQIEVEYQADTVGKYQLEFENDEFKLINTKTDCLAKDNCGIPIDKIKKPIAEIARATANCCGPESNCC